MKDEKLFEIYVDILRIMYKEAKPSADLDKLMNSGATKKKNWFAKYYLPQERQEEIVKEEFKKYSRKLDKIDKKKIENELWLGASPTSWRREDE